MLFFFKDDYLMVSARSPRYGLVAYSLDFGLGGRHPDSQITRIAQVFHMLRGLFSVVEHLYLYRFTSSDWNIEVDRTRWRELLRTFGNVKTLHIQNRLIEQLSRSLQPGEGESPMDLLPELQKITYSASGSLDDAFAPFIEARQKAGRPVTVLQTDESRFLW
jgi:hypothetical protein